MIILLLSPFNLNQEENKYNKMQQNDIKVYQLHSLGMYTITFYCSCQKCCGKTNGITATGTQVKINKTIAVDPKVIPLGSTVFIDGKSYIAEDVGGGVKKLHIDIYVSTHQEAINRGKIKREVFIRGDSNELPI